MAEEDNRYRSLAAPGMGAEAASDVILRTLADRSGLHVREIGPGRISVSRTHRPALGPRPVRLHVLARRPRPAVPPGEADRRRAT